MKTSPVSALLAGALLLLVAFATMAHAQSDLSGVMKVSVGVNGVWFDGPKTEVPRDLEIGATASASLSQHIDVVGQGYYGFDNSYFRWTVGPRIGLSDPKANLSIAAGVSYHASSEAALRPDEWSPDVTVGWKPWSSVPGPGMPPDRLNRVTLGVQGWYGLESQRAGGLLAVRYNIWKQGGPQ